MVSAREPAIEHVGARGPPQRRELDLVEPVTPGEPFERGAVHVSPRTRGVNVLPMRALLLLSVSVAVGCAEDCPPPSSMLNSPWIVHNHVVVQDPVELDPAYPGETSPANGEHVLQIRWDSVSLESPVTVILDDQEFPGQGAWDERECGNFGLTWEGTYVARDGRVTHDFSASAQLQTWEGHLEGTWKYVELWDVGDVDGRVAFDVQMFGTP